MHDFLHALRGVVVDLQFRIFDKTAILSEKYQGGGFRVVYELLKHVFAYVFAIFYAVKRRFPFKNGFEFFEEAGVFFSVIVFETVLPG